MSSNLSVAPPKGVVLARNLLDIEPPSPAPSAWRLDALAGRYVELTGAAATAALTACAALILEAQQRGELAAWIAGERSTFYPPDFAASGIDVEALPVVRVDDARDAARAADTLIRSGSFALVVLDLGSDARFSLGVQSRLTGLAKHHHTALLCITRTLRQTASRGSLVSLRAETETKRVDFDRFACELRVLKDKRRAPGAAQTEICRGPDGLC